MNWLKGPTSKKYRNNLFKILLISILVVAILQLIYITGGTKMVFVQLLYIPIILSSLFWGTYSGLIAGVVCGILVGPFIPLDVPNGIMQDPINWISRLLIFSLIGFLTGYMFERINRLNLKSPFYNLPNAQKLLRDIEERSKSKEKFKLFSIKLTNLNDIEKYVDNKLVFAIVDNLAKKLSHCCGRNAIYSYEKDELIILACKSCNYDYEEKIKEILEDYFDFPVSMGGI